MQFPQAKTFILDKLKKELPAFLTYHKFEHTLDVYRAAENLAALEKINKQGTQLLLTATLYHDAGFIQGNEDHEKTSCLIAMQYLPGFAYNAIDIITINGMIMATKLPQAPKNLLEEIICDADLDYLGRDDFFPISDCLYKEFCLAGIVHSDNEWNKLQLSFFESHHYFTKSALKLRQRKKEENLLLIRAKIK